MKLKEMQSCASETLDYFITVMPNVPFCANEITIEFVPKSRYVERFKALCLQCSPDRSINKSEIAQMERSIFANAIIGRTISAAIIKLDYSIEENDMRRIVFHELMHIYCGKTEMDTDHFIDVYGSLHTPDRDPVDKMYDGFLNAGYFVWSEFIAEYYAITKTAEGSHYFVDIKDIVYELLTEIDIINGDSKVAYAMMSAYVLSCDDAATVVTKMRDIIQDDVQYDENTVNALHDCLNLLYDHIQSENPCKISEDFISRLGEQYLMILTFKCMANG